MSWVGTKQQCGTVVTVAVTAIKVDVREEALGSSKANG